MASREIPGIGGVHAFFDNASGGYADGAGGINASFIKFSTLSQLRVLDRVTAAELAGLSPSQNDIYIVTDGTDATKIHARDDGAWFKITPKSGWIGFDVALDDFIWFDGSAWQEGLPGTGGGTPTESIIIAVSDESTDLTTGTAKVTFRMPYGFVLTDIRDSVNTAGTALQVDVNEGGVSILSTKLTSDSGEKTTTTAVAPPVISDPNLASDAEMTIDIDSLTGSWKGLKIALIGHQ